MTFATWYEEFYPVASHKLKDESPTTQVEAMLRKWRGTLPAALERHGLMHERGEMELWSKTERGPIAFVAETCVLCLVHRNLSPTAVGLDCGQCPLVQVRGASCCRRLPEEACCPYRAWETGDDPLPMIHLLEKALAHCREKEEPDETE